MSAMTMVEPEVTMNSVAKVTEISAISETSFEDACRLAIERAGHSLRNIRAAWIKEQSLEIRHGKIVGFKVDMKVTFVLDGD